MQLFSCSNKRSFQKVLVDVLEAILSFHKRAMGFFRRSGLSLRSVILGTRAAWDCCSLGFSQGKEQRILGRNGCQSI